MDIMKILLICLLLGPENFIFILLFFFIKYYRKPLVILLQKLHCNNIHSDIIYDFISVSLNKSTIFILFNQDIK
jgi:hypothetical protein